MTELLEGSALWAAIMRFLQPIMPLLVMFALLLGPTAAGLMIIYWYAIRRALTRRRAFIIVPTSRSDRFEEPELLQFGRAVSQVRLRRRNWLMQPAGAVRFSLDNANGFSVVHNLAGPPWMRSLLDTNNMRDLMVAAKDRVDPNFLSNKSIRPPLSPEGEPDAPTVPIVGPPLMPPPPSVPPPDGRPELDDGRTDPDWETTLEEPGDEPDEPDETPDEAPDQPDERPDDRPDEGPERPASDAGERPEPPAGDAGERPKPPAKPTAGLGLGAMAQVRKRRSA